MFTFLLSLVFGSRFAILACEKIPRIYKIKKNKKFKSKSCTLVACMKLLRWLALELFSQTQEINECQRKLANVTINASLIIITYYLIDLQYYFFNNLIIKLLLINFLSGCILESKPSNSIADISHKYAITHFNSTLITLSCFFSLLIRKKKHSRGRLLYLSLHLNVGHWVTALHETGEWQNCRHHYRQWNWRLHLLRNIWFVSYRKKNN